MPILNIPRNEECGETTNCLLYSSERLRLALMLTTAAIMSVGLVLDVGVWYHAKSVVLFNPEQKKIKREENRAAVTAVANEAFQVD